jgi:methionyl-tRNA synthetase
LRYLVTSALPYANGPVHFGQVVGAYLPADVYVRTLRMQGEDVRFICGTDEHGVAITIKADQEGLPYPQYVARWRADIKATFDRLGIEFDVWSGTSISPFHAELSREFFSRLQENGFLLERQSEQLYCEQDDMFLADRYVLGTCFVCGREGARGDECPRCGSWLDPLKLIHPTCKLCGSTPQRRETKHWYLDLPKLREEFLDDWFSARDWKPNVRAFVDGMLSELQPRPITRDMRWGVELSQDLVGGETGKVLYVWFDAPIGYISFTKEWAVAQGRPDAWRDYWLDPATRLVHFIGKDNIAFHCVVFPAMLAGVRQDYVLPWQVPANEFYNLQGRKFSTSDNWTIDLHSFFDRFDAQDTRFYLLSSLPETADSEWRWEGFQQCVASLADTVGNLVTRVLRFAAKHYGSIPRPRSADLAELDRILLRECGPLGDPAEHVRAFRFRRAAEQLLSNATAANVFVDRMAPWTLQRTDPERAASVLSTCCEWLAWMAHWMAPFMPQKAQRLWAMLGLPGEISRQPWPGLPREGSWRRFTDSQKLGNVEALFAKIDDATIESEVAALESRAQA